MESCKRIFSMIVMEKKSANEFKDRLVMRGDTISEDETAFSSAPTTGRGSISTLLMFATYFGWDVSSLDVTQAFLPIDDLSRRDKRVISVPPFIRFTPPTSLKRCEVPGMDVVSETIFLRCRGISTNRCQKPKWTQCSRWGWWPISLSTEEETHL